jgi:D-tyrosyl-tRNA(Tyr) deacylase
VQSASVSVGGQTVGQIARGSLVFLGVMQGDTDADVDYLAGKVGGLRIFADTAGKMNCALADVAGGVLVISQFTICGDCRKGRRPAFTDAAAPDLARELYTRFCQRLRAAGLEVAEGVFAADMQVQLVNDGPVTMLLDSRRLF